MNLRDLIGVLGHELRTPLAAILGYQELLADGIYGDLDEKKHEPIERIHQSAQQLLHLIDGLQELAAPAAPDPGEVVPTDLPAILAQLLASAKPFAGGRSVTLTTAEVSKDSVQLPAQRFLRAADLALVAAIKASSGNTLTLSLTAENPQIIFTIDGTALDPESDDPNTNQASLDAEHGMTAAQLRLAMAVAALRVVGGSLTLSRTPAGTRVELQVPSA